jgi:hypothetical protein
MLKFSSSDGCFEDYFSIYGTKQADGEQQLCTAGIGLFQWLKPYEDGSNDWTDGYCVGYQESMLSIIEDPIFDASRAFGTFAVLISFVVFLWVFMLSCLELNRIQSILLRILCFLGALTTGLGFLLVCWRNLARNIL